MSVAILPSVGNMSIHNMIDRYGASEVKGILEDLEERDAQALYYDWAFWRRPAQIPPEAKEWRIWFLKSGRGSGKTRVGAEFIREKSDSCGRMHLIGRTAADVRDTIVEGDSGLLNVSPPWNKPQYIPSKRRVEWPNGSKALCFSADEPSLLRGPQCEAGWADEIASWRYPQETWDNFMFGLRLGRNPQAVVTSTPRPIKIVKDLVDRSVRKYPTVYVTTESTYANRMNLAEGFFSDIITVYEGSRLGQQELLGKVLDDNPNALWTTEKLDELRRNRFPKLDMIGVGVDPNTSDKPGQDTAECGIIVAGIKGKKGALDSKGYVLDDLSIKGSPREWGNAAITAYHKYDCDFIVAESNNGGALVKANIQAIDPDVPVKLVFASRGKRTRAEPIATLYETNRVHHIGMFAELEQQQTEWEPGELSPDRMDGLVWILTELMLGPRQMRLTAH